MDNSLDLQLYQRSADIAIGVPFNVASYSLLLTLLANECGYTPGTFRHVIGDAHIYDNHIDGISTQVGRTPKHAPKLQIDYSKNQNMLDLKPEDITITDYEHHPFIKFEVAV